MSAYITGNQILDFAVSLEIQHRSANTISSYTTNIQKLELFLDGRELSKERMLSYKRWLSEQGLDNYHGFLLSILRKIISVFLKMLIPLYHILI